MKFNTGVRERVVDGIARAVEAGLGRRRMNRIAAFFYWRSRGENLGDPERNGEYRVRDAFELLAPAGCRLCKLRPSGLLAYEAYQEALDSYSYSNWLAIRTQDYDA